MSIKSKGINEKSMEINNRISKVANYNINIEIIRLPLYSTLMGKQTFIIAPKRQI